MFITGLGTAAPPRRYEQKECWEVLQQSRLYHELSPRSRALCKKVLTGNNGIVARHLVLENLHEAFALTPDDLHARFVQHAPQLATQAAEEALADSGTQPHELDGIIVSTCTGYLCPGLTSYLSERLGLRQDVLTLDLVGQGCGAALPNLRAAEAFLAARSCARVLCVCVEVCSAALYFDDDPGVLISACLFGDGAGAAVVAREPHGKRRIQWRRGGSLLKPADRDSLRFEQRHGMLRNILTPQVPALAAEHARTLFDDVISRAGVAREAVKGWVFHPGGRDVLIAVRERLGLDQNALRWSEAVLREFGNVSSSSVFFVLKAAFEDSAPDGLWWMSSFGAGFSCHGALLEVKRRI